ncbi:MAG: hypothetical protein H8D87_08650 [Deltaproteobacteria bacterium]|uniref:hypothetical protein n=1 Tax=Desulfobacula sp. TaxID=2593537 RepID=UPI0019CD4BE1|nr:hypothetical protein [Candidatus Desulfobacula maris]MBL6995706.1 hypothetical protein [Desulfobacula sp.]
MKKPITIKKAFYPVLFCLILGLFIFFPPLTAFSSESGLSSRIKKAIQKIDKKQQVEASIPALKQIVQVNVKDQGGTFFTQARKSEIKRFRCSACHNNKPVPIDNAARISHADIQVVHGDQETPLACNTCHSNAERDFLVAGEGTKIDLDHVYDMCGQCHFRQKKDWIGGAHGKRVTYWAGERVVKNCTSCHNPHSPRFEKQWPKTYSVPLK